MTAIAIWVALALSGLALGAWTILVMDFAKLETRVEVLENEIVKRVEAAIATLDDKDKR